MNVKRVVLVLGVAVLAVALFLAGTAFGQSPWGDRDDGWTQNAPNGWGYGHMSGWDEENGPYRGMMGAGQAHMGSMMNSASMGQFHAGMMGWGGLADVEPLSIEDAETALLDFLAESEEENLALGEIMIFENHAYAQIVDSTTGNGAFEVLVDPVTGNVYPEPGPNMMWNTEFGHMAGGGMMAGYHGGMMNGYRGPGANSNGEADVDATDAVALAQAYLDEFLPGATVDQHADAFPGYYTLHVLRDGQVVGMLSVNAFGGDVFPHTWHGDFVTMTEGHAD